jgi:hypothetical protein
MDHIENSTTNSSVVGRVSVVVGACLPNYCLEIPSLLALLFCVSSVMSQYVSFSGLQFLLPRFRLQWNIAWKIWFDTTVMSAQVVFLFTLTRSWHNEHCGTFSFFTYKKNSYFHSSWKSMSSFWILLFFPFEYMPAISYCATHCSGGWINKSGQI